MAAPTVLPTNMLSLSLSFPVQDLLFFPEQPPGVVLGEREKERKGKRKEERGKESDIQHRPMREGARSEGPSTVVRPFRSVPFRSLLRTTQVVTTVQGGRGRSLLYNKSRFVWCYYDALQRRRRKEKKQK